MAVEYKIRVQNELTTKVEGLNSLKKPTTPESQSIMRPSNNGSVTSSIGKTIAINMGKQALNYGVSKMGDLTGNYRAQTIISETLNIVSLGLMAISGPIGIAAAISSVALSSADYAIGQTKENRRVAILKARTGGAR